VHLTPVLEAAFCRANQLVGAATTVALTRESSLALRGGAAPTGHESCGVLLGRSVDTRIVVERLVRTRNFSRRAGSFVLSLAAVAAAINQNRAVEFLGIFHTHTDAAVPSGTDVRAMGATRCLWLIAAPQRLAAFRVVDRAVESLAVEGD
jgi:proteasome lid subunit RPN8/RPN11